MRLRWLRLRRFKIVRRTPLFISPTAQDASESGLALSFSLRHNFPTEWHRFINSEDESLRIIVKKDHFPYLTQSFEINIDTIQLFSIAGGAVNPKTIDNAIDLAGFSTEINTGVSSNPEDHKPGEISIEFEKDEDEQVFLVLSYHLGSGSN
ncbi:MAG: hypothetical protein GTO45_12250 [Candidatus Aminicenantes bacterium]|nr:hypothetical protein [Candidatus Aminicenantes bacterium]NIM79574.1 hypothetical protein [Candidatus Aminicenantes bacterium]NIN18883.1 hypothetical protein [Candidatus Aminicenantes bacterium]NIN42793.1 hypothetical protein [Candidatus Aminicenantes bacterium]NIN85520.1 hypothetical protein [Candidatus Aminicenantes bacterium]